MRWISRAYMSVDYAWTYLKRTQLQCVICTVSSLPLSVMVRSCHACVVFFPRASFTLTLRSGSSPSPTRQWAGHIACTCTKGFHEIFKYAHLKFTVCGRSIDSPTYTRVRKAVTLVWGSLRLAPTSEMIYHRGGEPERAMHCWFNVMAHKPWITAGFATVCCSMSVVSNTLCSHFFGQWSY